jgi:hypothetical protein
LAFAVLVAIAGMAPSRGGEAAQDPGVTWLIFVDDLHIDFLNTGYTRELLRSIASELIRDGDAFVLRCSGPSGTSIQFTTNRSLLDAAIGRTYGNGLQLAALLWLPPAIETQDEVRYRASLAGSAATDMLNTRRSTSRRRAMLYISNGYHVDPPDALAGFASAAQRSNVTVFAMNARGLPGAPAVSVSGDVARWASYRAAMLNSLRAISEPTGGFAVLDEADFANAFLRITLWMR